MPRPDPYGLGIEIPTPEELAPTRFLHDINLTDQETGEPVNLQHRYDAWPRQVEFHRARSFYVVYGGARGGAKTRGIVEDILALMLAWPGIPVLLGRRDLQDLKKTTEEEWLKVTPRELWDPRYGGQYHKSERWYRMPNGSKLWLGELKDWESYKSATLGRIYIDELNEVQEEVVDNLAPTLRWTSGGGNCDRQECAIMGTIPPHFTHPRYQIKMATNPSAGWVKRRFWTPWKEGRQQDDHQFILSRAFDNPALPPSYIPSLIQNHPFTWVRNFVLGDWQSFENTAFPSLNRSVHAWRGPLPEDMVLASYGGIDYGAPAGEYSHRSVIVIASILRTGQIIVHTLYSKKGEATNDFFAQVAEYSRRWKVRRFAADGSQSRANELLRRSGIPVYDAPRGPGAVKDGLNQINRLLQPGADGRPSLYFMMDRVERLVEGMETYSLDPETMQPVKGQEDDEIDATRYLIDCLLHSGVTIAGPAPSTEYTVAGYAAEDDRSSWAKAIESRNRARLERHLAAMERRR